MKQGTTGSASVHIDAPPQKVYELVSDVTRMGDWSPECVRCEWIDGATGPAVGARFKGSNRKGLFRWTTKPRVVTVDDGHEFAFMTEFRGREGTKWTYRFEPEDGGARVTESFELMEDMPAFLDFVEKRLMRIKDRKGDLEQSMQATLERIKAAVEGRA